jgi:predicted KAP-like P-loop ATPase
MISPDSPITCGKDDRLGRAGFAKALAESIVRFENDDSFVIGIHGKWGSGKSSVLNLIVEKLSDPTVTNTEERVDILRFNPWNFADQSQLVLQFLRQFTSHLRQFDKMGKAKNLVDSLDKYATALGPPLEAVPYGKWFSGGVKLATRVLGANRDTDSLFNIVSAELKRLKRKTVVIIDDIDRLTAPEIRQVFQLVKLSARFPYVIYLLAFDRDAVSDALSDVGVKSGQDYLEKIVQVSFDLPAIEEQGLTTMITEAIDKVINTYQPAHFDRNRFANLFYSGFRHSLESLRDVRRFINGLEFGFGMIAHEVNGVDFIGIEALRVFHPKIFEVIRENKEMFAGHIDTFAKDEGHEAFRKKIERLFSSNGTTINECQELVVSLFPKLEFAYSNMMIGSRVEDSWEKDLRVCASRYFDFYFRLVVPESEVTVAEIDKTVASANNQLDVSDNLDEYIRTGRIKNALSSFRGRLKSLSVSQIVNVLGSLFNIGDRVKHEGSMLAGNFPEFWYVRWAIFDCMDLLNSEEQINVLKDICAITDGVGTAVAMIGLLSELQKQEPSKYGQFTDGVITELKGRVVARIAELASQGKLSTRPLLPAILTAWKNWGNSLEIGDYVATAVAEPKRLIRFVDQFIYQATSASAGDKVLKVDNRLDVGTLASLADIDEIAAKLQSLDEHGLSEDQKLIVDIARRGISEFKQSGLTPEQFQKRLPMA